MSSKIALCLYGKYNNRLSYHTGDDGFKYIFNVLLRKYDIDIFFHSWDVNKKNKILGRYKPYLKKYKFENQKDFKEVIKKRNINEQLFNPANNESFRGLSNSLSFFYSRKRAIEIKQSYEDHNNMSYPITIVARFDLGQIDKYNGYFPYKVSEINFNPEFDMNYIYSAMWNQLNCGYADQWFYSNSNLIGHLVYMYDYALDALQENSVYLQHITSGLLDSNKHDEFSNEIFKSDGFKSKDRVIYKKSQAINNHLMHKCFFIDNDLYKKSRFV